MWAVSFQPISQLQFRLSATTPRPLACVVSASIRQLLGDRILLKKRITNIW